MSSKDDRSAWLAAGTAVLFLNTAYLAAFASASLFYFANVGLHMALGRRAGGDSGEQDDDRCGHATSLCGLGAPARPARLRVGARGTLTVAGRSIVTGELASAGGILAMNP